MRISDWSSDVCSSDLLRASQIAGQVDTAAALAIQRRQDFFDVVSEISNSTLRDFGHFDETTRDHFRATLVKLASLVAIGLLILVAVYLHILWQFRVHKRLEAQQKESDELLRLAVDSVDGMIIRSEEHTSELQSLMRIS